MAGMLTIFKKAMHNLEAEVNAMEKDLKSGKSLPQGHTKSGKTDSDETGNEIGLGICLEG